MTVLANQRPKKKTPTKTHTKILIQKREKEEREKTHMHTHAHTHRGEERKSAWNLEERKCKKEIQDIHPQP